MNDDAISGTIACGDALREQIRARLAGHDRRVATDETKR
jgi:hypothetical protein